MTRTARAAEYRRRCERRRALAEKLRRRGISVSYEAGGGFRLGSEVDAEKILALIEVARETQRMEEGD